MTARVVRLHPFRYRDRVAEKWMQARHVRDCATRTRRYDQFEIGRPEVCEPPEDWQAMTPGM
jgi:hypothetical protein